MDTKRFLRLAARLYPASWRRRYGAEFAALLDDSGTNRRDLFDVLKGAVKMQIIRWNPGIILACGLAGLALSSSVAFSLHNIYVSRGMLRISSLATGNPAARNMAMADHMALLTADAFSRRSLAEIIQRPTLDLYKTDRAHEPLEDVIERMKQKDIKIELLGGPSNSFVLSFAYPDPRKAQKTVAALITKIVDANQVRGRDHGEAMSLDLLDPASLPRNPTAPNRGQIALLGLVAGLIAGVVTVASRRRRKITP